MQLRPLPQPNTHTERAHLSGSNAKCGLAKAWTLRFLALWLFIFIALFLRRPDALTNSQFWAEDALVFFAQQLTLGFSKALFHPYAGYLHVIPRLIAFLVASLPVKWIPFAYSFLTLFISSLCCAAFAGPWCRNLLRSDGLRATCCLVVATGLQFGKELIGVVANLQWFLAIGAATLVFRNKEGKEPAWLAVTLAVLGMLIGLTAPLTFAFVPFLLAQCLTSRGLKRLEPILMLTALAIQLFIAYASSDLKKTVHLDLGQAFLTTVAALISRPVTASLLGHSYLVHNSDAGLIAWWTFALIVVSVWLTTLSISVHGQRRRVLWGACYIGVVATLIPVLTRNYVGMFGSLYGLKYTPGERYFLLSAAVFVFLVAFTIECWLPKAPDRLKVGALLTIFLLGIINNFRVPRYQDFRWDSYAPQVQQWRDSLRNGKPVHQVVIPINPEGWQLTLPGEDTSLPAR
jgi:hypothetical protein